MESDREAVLRLKEAIRHLRDGQDLEPEQARDAALALVSESVDDPLRCEFLTVFSEKGETPEEVSAFAEAYLPLAVEPGIEGAFQGKALIDCCGTGGGGLDLVNLSTAMVFVLAAAGVPVVKHGNRGLTKKSGSADVLTALGIRIDVSPEQSCDLLERAGFCFFMAPLYHPAFKEVASARKELGAAGRRTVFNLLGPLLNPARPASQMVGLFQEDRLGFYAACLEALGRERFLLVYGESESGRPIGEASVIGRTHVTGSLEQSVDFEFPSRLAGGLHALLIESAEESAKRIEAVFRGESGEDLLVEMLAWNAGLGLWTQGETGNAGEGVDRARALIRGGDALRVLEMAREWSAAVT